MQWGGFPHPPQIDVANQSKFFFVQPTEEDPCMASLTHLPPDPVEFIWQDHLTASISYSLPGLWMFSASPFIFKDQVKAHTQESIGINECTVHMQACLRILTGGHSSKLGVRWLRPHSYRYRGSNSVKDACLCKYVNVVTSVQLSLICTGGYTQHLSLLGAKQMPHNAVQISVPMWMNPKTGMELGHDPT